MPNKANKKQVVKPKLTKTVKPSVAKKPVNKPLPTAKKAVKAAVKKPVKKPMPAKKPDSKANMPVKTAAKSVDLPKKTSEKVKTRAQASKKPVIAAEKPAKVTKSRKKLPKMDKKVARTLIKIANSQRTAVATVGVHSAAMAAVRATMAMAAYAANSNQPSAPVATNQSAANQSKLAAAPAVKPAFKTGDVVVYPAHGVGKVDGVEAHTIGGTEVKLFRITFDHERMTLKVPVQRASGSGLRALSSKETMKNVFETMKGRPRVRRVMWSRRAQEYEQKINSGDPVAIAEVLRDLRRNAESGDQSYSERQIFQNALERLSREVAAIEKIDQEKATQKLSDLLLRKLPAAANSDDAEDAA